MLFRLGLVLRTRALCQLGGNSLAVLHLGHEFCDRSVDARGERLLAQGIERRLIGAHGQAALVYLLLGLVAQALVAHGGGEGLL